jgi:hypothetical protein
LFFSSDPQPITLFLADGGDQNSANKVIIWTGVVGIDVFLEPESVEDTVTILFSTTEFPISFQDARVKRFAVSGFDVRLVFELFSNAFFDAAVVFFVNPDQVVFNTGVKFDGKSRHEHITA